MCIYIKNIYIYIHMYKSARVHVGLSALRSMQPLLSLYGLLFAELQQVGHKSLAAQGLLHLAIPLLWLSTRLLERVGQAFSSDFLEVLSVSTVWWYRLPPQSACRR